MSQERQEAGLRIQGVRKRFPGMTVLDGISLDIREGEFVTLLGPSGCGKTTLLRIVAGFEWPDEGAVTLDGQDICRLPPYRRPVNTVFQKPVLLPHLDVFENIAFGLRAKRMPRDAIRKQVSEILEVVRLPGFETRRSDELSGGQAQRVNLARALVNRPRVLLLDEPLSALDLQVRNEMQAELKRVHRETGVTFLYVTHDQQEAMAMSNRIAVMQAGAIRQSGTPDEIYHAPNSVFVAQFVGNANVLPVEAHRQCLASGRVHLKGGGASVRLATIPDDAHEGWICVRPESLRLAEPAGADLVGTVTDVSFLGAVVLWRIAVGDLEIRVCGEAKEERRACPGETVGIAYDPERVRFLRE